MNTPYRLDATGLLRPAIPPTCPWSAEASPPCRVALHHLRERQTGPCFPLSVVRRRVHGHAFTLYPDGHVPYGRVAMAPVSADGTLLRRAEADASDQDGAAAPLAWEHTVFAAAIDAAAGRSWASDSPADDPRRRRTQGRWIEQAAGMLAVAGCPVPSISPSSIPPPISGRPRGIRLRRGVRGCPAGGGRREENAGLAASSQRLNMAPPS